MIIVEQYDEIEILDFDDDIEILDFEGDLLIKKPKLEDGFIHTLLSAFFIGFTVGIGLTVLFYLFHLFF